MTLSVPPHSSMANRRGVWRIRLSSLGIELGYFLDDVGHHLFLAGDPAGGVPKVVGNPRRKEGAGVAAVFAETHQDPDNAPCDGPNMIRLENMPGLIDMLMQIDRLAKANPVQI